jgi:hypothetical protein
MVCYQSLHLVPHHLTLWSQSNAHRYNPLFYCKCKAFCIYIILYCIVSAKHCVFANYNSKKILGCKRWIDLVQQVWNLKAIIKSQKEVCILFTFHFWIDFICFWFLMYLAHPSFLNWLYIFLFLNDFQLQNKLVHQFIISQI